MSTPIGFVIQPGQTIPEDVTEVDDGTPGHSRWTRNGALWSCVGTQLAGQDESWVLGVYAPLTVTAVREPEPAASVSGLCEGGADKVTCIVMDADHRRIYHYGHPVPPYASTEALLNGAQQPLPAAESVPDVLDLAARDRPTDVPAFTKDKGEIHVTAVLDEQGAPRLWVQWPPGAHEDPRHDTLVHVMAELGVDRPEDVLGALAIIRTNRDQWLAQAKHYRQQRDEARARVKLLEADLESLATEAAQPDPRVLSLPQAAIALVGVESGRRYDRRAPFVWEPDEADSKLYGLQEVLEREGEVTVEVTPPREPRTWPKLDDAPPDLRAVRGASGRVYRPHDDGRDARWYYVDAAHGKLGFESFAEIAYQDGPLTEVLDEPGATS